MGNNYFEYKSKGDRKTLSVEEHLSKIKPYLKDIVNNLKKSETWKIQLTITTNFISSNDDNDEECVVHSENDNTEIMMSSEADEVIENLLKSFKKRYQNILEKWKVESLSSIMLIY